MNFNDFFEQARIQNTRLKQPDTSHSSTTLLLSNEALFQLPFLAMVILALSKGRRKPSMAEIGQTVGECLERTLAGFKGSSQHIGWSANLRIRTVKALTFLEISNLVEVNQREKIISATSSGKIILDAAITRDGPLGNTLRAIERNYRNIAVERTIQLELS